MTLFMMLNICLILHKMYETGLLFNNVLALSGLVNIHFHKHKLKFTFPFGQ